MSQKILIDGSNETQTQFALLSDNELEDFEFESISKKNLKGNIYCLLYTSPSPRDVEESRMPSSA